jgi:ubiquinone/menaquinone biosynthesis C-methylase UbiE
MMQRIPERELMDGREEARNYAGAKFPDVTGDAAQHLLDLTTRDAERALNVIDLGTGPGTIPIQLAKARPAWHITALDASREMIKIATIASRMAGVQDRVTPHLCNAKETALPDASFDIVFSNNFLHHMPDPVLLWREIKRLAAPGGLIVVRDLLRPETEARAHQIVDEMAANQPESFRVGYYDSLHSAFLPEEVREQLKAAGLSSLTVQGVAGRYLDIGGRVT